MGKRAQLLEQEEQVWDTLCRLLEKVPDWEQPGILDEWSVKDLLAHLAAWHAKTTDRLETLRMTGELPDPPDVDTFNAQTYDEFKDLSLHDVKVMSGASRHRMREEMAMLKDEDATDLQQMIVGNAHGHYDEHIEQLERYLSKGSA
jgi:hypothetical protein